ncbi:hypothetical protein B0I35DRAFT_484843 [Stachybotrys elegans]|uniref:Uncharacterized protein n=1 Tax=Stachybotrys elegans TaxID=80388 RepID=A0A8K0SBX2_9HYPO|nr:hypothetical protein B0I35DRAFT_484843 [Stachybotrys elegans]
MVLFNVVTAFSLQALGASAISTPAEQHETYAAARESFDPSKVQISPEALFAPSNIKTYDPALSVPHNESIFEISDVEFASLSTEPEGQGLSKRSPLPHWESVSVRACWSIAGISPTTYFLNFLHLQARLQQNGGSSVVVAPNRYWEYIEGNVRLIVRNQNSCYNSTFVSNELAVILTAIWERCTNNASGWAWYSWLSSTGWEQYNPSFIVLVLPNNKPIPNYTREVC